MENDYYVIESRIYNEGNTLKCEYKLGKQTDYFVDPIPHEKIRGAVIEARTVHIARTDESKSEHGRTDGSSDNLEGRTMGIKPVNIYVAEEQEKNNNRSQEVKASDIAVMTVDLTEGLRKLGGAVQSEADKYAGKSYFPYVTPYSQTNTGFTPAPEPNDRVALYFPSENETHALVMGAVNNNGNGRFTNPDKRNFTLGPSQAARGGTPANEGKPMYNFTLDSEKFIVSVGSIISLHSSGSVSVNGTETVGITSKAISISGTESVGLTTKTLTEIGTESVYIESNKSAEINSKEIVTIKGKNVTVDPKTKGIFGNTGALVEVLGSDVKLNG